MPPDPQRSLLDVTGITAGYRRMQVLWGVDLAVRERESVVLLGANGAGKTTLLKAIMSLVDVWSGRVEFAGEDITRFRTDQRVRRGIAFMSETSGFPGLTIEENILIGAQFMPKARTRERMGDLYAVFPGTGGAPPRACRQPVGRPAKNARHRQGAGRRAAAAGDGRTVRRIVAASSSRK